MIEFGHETVQTCDGVSRREFLQIGAAGFLGISLPGPLATQQAQSAHYTLTGSKIAPGREAPNLGTVVNRFLPQRNSLPSSFHIGPRMYDTAGNGPVGQEGGFLDNASAPFRILDSKAPVDKLASLTPPTDLTGDRMNLRHELFKVVDGLMLAKVYVD